MANSALSLIGLNTGDMTSRMGFANPSSSFAYQYPNQAPKTWYDNATGKTMELYASSGYFDFKGTGNTWQGTRVDIYKVSLGAVSSPYSMPLTPSYDNPYNLPMQVFPTSYEVYDSVISKDVKGKVEQTDTLLDRKTVSYSERVEMGKPDLTAGDVSKGEKLRTSYQTMWEDKFKKGSWWTK